MKKNSFFHNVFKLITVFALHYISLYLAEAIFITVTEFNYLSTDILQRIYVN